MGRIAELAGKRIYLDTNIFIYALEDYPDWHEAVSGVFEAIGEGKLFAFTSELILTELLTKPLALDRADLVETYLESLENQPSLSLVPISRDILIRAAVLRATHRLRTPDAIHMATALIAKCDVAITNDKGIKQIDGLQVMQLSDFQT